MNKDDGVVLRPMNDKVIVETVVIVETDGGILLPELDSRGEDHISPLSVQIEHVHDIFALLCRGIGRKQERRSYKQE